MQALKINSLQMQNWDTNPLVESKNGKKALLSSAVPLSLFPWLIHFIKIDFQMRQRYGFSWLPELICLGSPRPQAASFL